MVVDVGKVFPLLGCLQACRAGTERGEGIVEHLTIQVVNAQVLLGKRVVADRRIGEELHSAQIGFDGLEVLLSFRGNAPQRIPGHSRVVVLATRRAVVVRSDADKGIGGEGNEALVVGLRAKDGVKGSIPAGKGLQTIR